jgi:hypothetical protein
MFPGLSDTDAEFCVNFILITRTMVELAGRFTIADKDDRRFKMLKKATCHINNGQDVYFADYDYRVDGALPEILYIKTPHFSKDTSDIAPLRTVAVFNISDDDGVKKVISREGLGLAEGEYILTDVWSGERLALNGKCEILLDAHASRLFSVNKLESAVILDSNVELCGMRFADGVFEATLTYPYDCELTLTKKPTSVSVNGEPVDFTIDGKVLKFRAKDKGKIIINLK